ncbi:hypothetical protein Asppvi_009038 [Aspergillus pseudoviridinutans]|uniref:Xylanolytic transcriptional activator regulatory domain-containing protein n=1 Tax=Aspergillus pseudoviridinutans TaxID=1517512 RepID=A0A9P3BJF1_9EURO|nr:uncharacterized protein Asppvi_009038 [Aspergillus pseudoviridinutans]GIJ90088.1 hypothetical protein Asppvi_009038 [Aspergillus pseudoviridinutans]
MTSRDRSFSASPYADLSKGNSPASDCGSLQLTQSSTNYVNSAHWAAILDGIADLKILLDEEEVQENTQLDEPSFAQRGGPQLLYGCTSLLTKEEILAAIPERPVVDRLISGYFNSFDMSPDPGIKTPASSLREHDLQCKIEAFRQKIVQCLILGEYAKGPPYVLETLMLYIAVEVVLRSDAEIGIWILLGTIVQLAMHMGYHRDPHRFPSMSPFTAEMRKRVWATVVELDIGISTQMGLPRLIKHWQTDTGEPSNLHDKDFDRDTVAMPSSRPETELTPMLFRLVKARMTTTIGFVWDLVTDTRPCPYAEIMKMDSMLEDVHSAIPQCLQWVSMANCIMDSPQVIMQKVFLEIMFHRARIVLHQRNLHSWQADTQNDYSQQACLDAALKLLDYQHALQEETQPFCRLYQERWRVHSLVNDNFLLATSILCSYLQRAGAQSKGGAGAVTGETIWTSLQKTYNIWVHSSSSSKEAQKAARALRVILGNRNCFSSNSASDETNPLLLQIPPASFHDDPICPDSEGSRARFNIQFPVFDATALANWSMVNDDIEGFPFTTPASSVDWQMIDTAINGIQSHGGESPQIPDIAAGR